MGEASIDNPVPRWEAFVADSVLGAQRGGGPARAEAVFDWLDTGAPDASPAAARLRQAAALGAYVQAGRRFEAGSAAAILACGPETRPLCSPAAAALLARTLENGQKELLAEWCALANKAGLRAPEELLPAILDHLAATPEADRDAMMPVTGERGAWLASLNPAWSELRPTHESAEVVWETGRPRDRVAALVRMRQEDAAKARERLAGGWAAEDPEHKPALLDALAQKLSLEDEPFLEKALDDKRRQVRLTAAKLLSRLPASAFNKRMLARLASSVRYAPAEKRSLLKLKAARAAAMEVEPPAACDEAMTRDAILPKPSGKRFGEKAWWLMQIVALTPPGAWRGQYGADPATLIAAAHKTDWAEPMLAGWCQAAATHRDAEWATALAPYLGKQINAEDLGDTLAALEPAASEAVVLAILPDSGWGRQSEGIFLAALLAKCNHAWSAGFTRAVLAPLLSGVRGKDAAPAFQSLQSLIRLVHRMEPRTARQTLAGIEDSLRDRPGWQGVLSTLITTLDFRCDIHKEMHS